MNLQPTLIYYELFGNTISDQICQNYIFNPPNNESIIVFYTIRNNDMIVLLTYNDIYERIKSSIILHTKDYWYTNKFYYINKIVCHIHNEYYSSKNICEITFNPNKLNFDIDLTKPFKFKQLIENII